MSGVAAASSEYLSKEIQDIRTRLEKGEYDSEAAISQGVVLRLLSVLGWPPHDMRTVIPEYVVKGTRVDYALCHPPEKPIAFIEVKKNLDQAQRDKAEEQLFQYAFHQGVPFVVLTDGREWNFFLPAGKGNYAERLVYKLDLAERNPDDCAYRLKRYLRYDAIRTGKAYELIQKDYDDVTRKREIQTALPKAVAQLIADKDELLLDLVAEQAGKLCGYQPDRSVVASFLKGAFVSVPISTSVPSVARSRKRKNAATKINPPPEPVKSSSVGFFLDGAHYPARSARDMLEQVFEALIARDPTFAERFAALPKHGRKRRYLAQDRNSLYPGRPDITQKQSRQLSNGWWLGGNYSRQQIGKIIERACGVAMVRFGTDLRVELGQAKKQN